jgi:HemY protein
MRKILALSAKIALALTALLWLAAHPGSVRLQWQETVVDLSLLAATGVWLSASLTLVGLDRLWRAMRTSGFGLVGAQRRRRQRGMEALRLGLLAAAAGDVQGAAAKAEIVKRCLRGQDTAWALPLTAHLAEQTGETDKAAAAYAAMLKHADLALLGHRRLLEMARARSDAQAAQAHTLAASALAPKAPWVAKAMADLKAGDGDWKSASQWLAGQVEKKPTPVTSIAKRGQSALLVEEARALAQRGDKTAALAMAEQAHRLDPDRPAAAALLIEGLAEAGQKRKAEKLALDLWRRLPHPDIAKALERLDGKDDSLDAVKRLQRLVALTPQSATAHLSLAAAAQRAALWGVARTHAEKAVSLQPGKAAYRLLAAIARSEKADAATERAWLDKALDAPDDPSWHCDACNAASQDWHALCPRCGSLDRLAWRSGGGLAILPALPSPSPSR